MLGLEHGGNLILKVSQVYPGVAMPRYGLIRDCFEKTKNKKLGVLKKTR